jgi:hypothetical protein
MRRFGGFPFQGNIYLLIKPLGVASHKNRHFPHFIAFLLKYRSGLYSCSNVWRIGNTNGIFASLRRMEAGYLAGGGTRHRLPCLARPRDTALRLVKRRSGGAATARCVRRTSRGPGAGTGGGRWGGHGRCQRTMPFILPICLFVQLCLRPINSTQPGLRAPVHGTSLA